MRRVTVVAGLAGLIFACANAGRPCELSHGVCAGKKRARIADGGFEPVCTALSYGPDYEPSETRCDGLDNDCDGVVDQPTSIVLGPTNSMFLETVHTDAGILVTGERGPIYLVDATGFTVLASHSLDPPTEPDDRVRAEFLRVSGKLVVAQFFANATPPYFIQLTALEEDGRTATVGASSQIPPTIEAPDSGLFPWHVVTTSDSTITSLWYFNPQAYYFDPATAVWAMSTYLDGGLSRAAILFDDDGGEAAGGVGASRPIVLEDGTLVVASGFFGSNDTSRWSRVSHFSSDFSRFESDLEYRRGHTIVRVIEAVADERGLGSVAALVKDPDRLSVVRSPFDGGTPVDWAYPEDGGFIAGFTGVKTTTGLRAAWISVDQNSRPELHFSVWTATGPGKPRFLRAATAPSDYWLAALFGLSAAQLEGNSEATFVTLPENPDGGTPQLVELRSCRPTP